MNREQAERYRALADFMEWADPEGYAQIPTTDQRREYARPETESEEQG